MDDGMGRRRYLQVLGAIGVTSLAGCFGQSASDTTTDRTPTSTETTTDTPTETSTLTATATDTQTETATETETSTETATETPVARFDDPVLTNDETLSWEEVDSRFEDEVYQETIAAEDSEVARAVEDVEVVTESAMETFYDDDMNPVQREVPARVNMVAETLENVHAALRDEDVYGEEADMTKTMEGLKYVFDQNDIDSSQVLINELSVNNEPINMEETYYQVIVGQGEDTQKILTWGSDVEDDSITRFNGYVKIPQEQEFKFGIVNGREEKLWFPILNNLEADLSQEEGNTELSSINFNQVDNYINNMSSEDMNDYMGRLESVFAHAIDNDKLIVGDHESGDSVYGNLFNDERGGKPTWDPYQDKVDVHYSEEAQDFIDSIIPQEHVNENPATAGEDNRNIVTTASLFFHEYVAGSDETDMQVDYFEDEGSIEEQIQALEQEDSDFMAMETETGGYMLYTTAEAHGPLNVENPALRCDFDRQLTGRQTCWTGGWNDLGESADERMQNRTGPDDIDLEDQP